MMYVEEGVDTMKDKDIGSKDIGLIENDNLPLAVAVRVLYELSRSHIDAE